MQTKRNGQGFHFASIYSLIGCDNGLDVSGRMCLLEMRSSFDFVFVQLSEVLLARSKSNVRSLVQMALIQCCKCVEIQARHAAIVNSKKAISNTVTNMK